MASVFKRQGDKRWTMAYFDHEGNRREKASGTTDKRLALRLAADMSDRELERVRGLVDPAVERMAAERARPLSEHFDDYGTHLESLQRDTRHVESTLRYLRKLADAMGWNTLASIDAHALTAHLSEQAEQRGTGARTFNATATAWRAFGRWCVRSNRLAANPLAGIGTRNTDGDRRRVRRDVSTDELARIIDAAERSPVVVVAKPRRNAKGELTTGTARMDFPDRAWAYRIAAGTGFRAGEVASLTPASFDLDGDTPSVIVEAAYSKRRRRDVQQIRPDLASLLRPWLASKAHGERACPLPEGKAGLLLGADMDAARATWINEARTPTERAEREASDFLRQTDSAGRVVDFHGLRVHYISRVVEAGANVKEAMELARHSDPKLTLKTYARVGIHDLSRVLDGMPKADIRPAPHSEPMRATGTDGSADRCQTATTQKSPHSADGTGRDGAASCGRDAGASDHPSDRNTLKLAGLREPARRGAGSSGNAPRRTRTTLQTQAECTRFRSSRCRIRCRGWQVLRRGSPGDRRIRYQSLDWELSGSPHPTPTIRHDLGPSESSKRTHRLSARKPPRASGGEDPWVSSRPIARHFRMIGRPGIGFGQGRGFTGGNGRSGTGRGCGSSGMLGRVGRFGGS